MLKKLFKNVPSDYLKLNMKGYVSTGSYSVDGEVYETFVHPENNRIQLTVNVDTLEIVDISVGRYRVK